MGKRRTLSDEQAERFARDGFVYVPRAFDPRVADEIVAELTSELVRDGIEPSKPPGPRSTLGRRGGSPFTELNTPTVLGVLEDLLEPTRYDARHLESHGAYLVSFPGFDRPPWHPPYRLGPLARARDVGHWHIDHGYEIRDYVDLASGNCALVPIFLLTPNRAGGGSTVLLPGSHRLIAKLLHAAGGRLPMAHVVAFCEHLAADGVDFVEATGDKGDFYVLHPLLVHSASANVRDEIRMMANTGVSLTGGRGYLQSDQPLSLVDRPILDAISEDTADVGPSWFLKWQLRFNHTLWHARHFGRVKGRAAGVTAALGGRLVERMCRPLLAPFPTREVESHGV